MKKISSPPTHPTVAFFSPKIYKKLKELEIKIQVIQLKNKVQI